MSARRRERGALERTVLELLWSKHRPVTAGELQHDLLERGDALAITTVLTVLSRLEAKGSVERSAAAGRSVFAPTRSATVTAADSMLEALSTVEDRDAALQRFAGSLSEEDLETLRRALDA